MRRLTKSYQSDSVKGGPNCLLPQLSNSKVRKKERCAPPTHPIGMREASKISHGSVVTGHATCFTTMSALASAQFTACPIGR